MHVRAMIERLFSFCRNAEGLGDSMFVGLGYERAYFNRKCRGTTSL